VRNSSLFLMVLAAIMVCSAMAQEKGFDPTQYPYWEGKGTKDPAAREGEAFRREPPGAAAHVWWHSFKLKPGYYELHVRARVDEGFEGSFHLVLVDTSKGEGGVSLDHVSKTKNVWIRNTEYEDIYAGTIYYDGSFPFRISDYSHNGIYIDYVYLKPISRTEIRDPELPPLPTYQIPRLPEPPVIDGALDDWAAVEPLGIGAEPGHVHIPDYGGPADCSAHLYMAWDPDNLYVACDVADNDHLQTCSDETLYEIWGQDSLQMGFDPGHNTKLPQWDEGDFEYGVALTANGPRMFRWYAANEQLPKGRVDAGQMAFVRDEEARRTIYEFALPWHELLMDPLHTREMGFNIIVNDADAGRGRGWIEWTSGIAETKDPTNWGAVTLIDAPETAGHEVRLWLIAANEYSDEESAEVELRIWSGRAFNPCKAELAMYDEHNAHMFSVITYSIIKAGENTITERLDLRELANGSYTLVVVLSDPDGVELAWADLPFIKADASELLAKADAIKEQAAGLRRGVEQLKQAGTPYEYVLTSAAVADAFDMLVRMDIAAKRLMRAQTVLDKLQEMLRRAEMLVDELLAHPEHAVVVPVPDIGSVVPRDGTFYAGDQECLMLGMMGWANSSHIMPLASEMGFNCAGVVGPYALNFFPAANVFDTAWVPYITRMLDYSSQHNIGVWWHMSPAEIPKWAVGDEPFCGYSEAWREINRKYLGWFCEQSKDCPEFLGIIINGEGGHGFTDHPLYVEEFCRRMQEQYRTIEALNAAWDSDYQSFEALTYPTDVDSRASWYDLCRFNQDMLTEWLGWKTEFIHSHDPQALTYAFPSVLGANDPTDFSGGWDHEAIMNTLDVIGGDGGVNYTGNEPGAQYAMATLGYLWWMELLRSYDKSKAVYDWEYHTTIKHQEYPPEYCRAHTLQAMLHGQDCATLWVWEPNHTESRLVEDPLVLEAYGHTALDIRRLSHEIASFGRPESEVAILSAISSMPDAGHIQGYISAYIGSFFLDAPVDFITERQIAAGRLADYKLLIVPDAMHGWDSTYNAIVTFALMGGKLLISRGSLTRDEHDNPRSAKALYALENVHTIEPGTDATAYAKLLDPVYDDVGIIRLLRVRDENGEPIQGVDFRYKLIDGEPHCYLINMNKAPVTVRLVGDNDPTGGYDLLEREDVEFPLEMQPLEVRIIRLN